MDIANLQDITCKSVASSFQSNVLKVRKIYFARPTLNLLERINCMIAMLLGLTYLNYVFQKELIAIGICFNIAVNDDENCNGAH